jgi:hypothetical protein
VAERESGVAGASVVTSTVPGLMLLLIAAITSGEPWMRSRTAVFGAVAIARSPDCTRRVNGKAPGRANYAAKRYTAVVDRRTVSGGYDAHRLGGAVGFVGLAGIFAASAGDENAMFARLKALLPPGKTSTLCLARSYDAEHLKAHPKQQVTKLVLSVRYVPLSEEDAILESRDDGGTDKRISVTTSPLRRMSANRSIRSMPVAIAVRPKASDAESIATAAASTSSRSRATRIRA